MLLKTILFIVIFFLNFKVIYAQLISIELIYKQISEDSIEIQLHKFTECNEASVSPKEYCQVFEGQTSLFQQVLSLNLTYQADTTVFTNQICNNTSRYSLKHIVYSAKIFNYNAPGGSDIVYAEKVNTDNVRNLINEFPDQYLIISTHIPEKIINSQSTLSKILPLQICNNQDVQYYLECIDGEGDSVSYSFIPVLTLRESKRNEILNFKEDNKVIPLEPPYENIKYQSGFTAVDPFKTGNPLKINSDLSVFFSSMQEGNYLIGISIREYRTQKQISERQIIFISKSIN